MFNFGIGDRLVAIGLFRDREGEVKNIPVIRSGIVSAMPVVRISCAWPGVSQATSEQVWWVP